MTDAAVPGGTFGVGQAAFIGVGAMVGAGIFALLGAAAPTTQARVGTDHP